MRYEVEIKDVAEVNRQAKNAIQEYFMSGKIRLTDIKKQIHIGLKTTNNIILAYGNVQEYGATMTVTEKQRMFLLSIGIAVKKGSTIHIPATRFLSRTFMNGSYQTEFDTLAEQQMSLLMDKKITTKQLIDTLGTFWVNKIKSAIDSQIKHKDMSTGQLRDCIGYWLTDKTSEMKVGRAKKAKEIQKKFYSGAVKVSSKTFFPMGREVSGTEASKHKKAYKTLMGRDERIFKIAPEKYSSFIESRSKQEKLARKIRKEDVIREFNKIYKDITTAGKKENLKGRSKEFLDKIDAVKGATNREKNTAKKYVERGVKRMVRYNRDINKPRKLTDVELEKSYRDRGVKITRTLAEKKSFLDNNLTLDQVKELNAKYKVGSMKVGLSKEEKNTKIAEFTKRNKDNPHFESAKTTKERLAKESEKLSEEKRLKDNQRIEELKEMNKDISGELSKALVNAQINKVQNQARVKKRFGKSVKAKDVSKSDRLAFLKSLKNKEGE